MSRVGVLAAAVALRRFTAARLAAYCHEDGETVAGILAEHAGLVEPLPGTAEWRVIDAEAIRRELSGAAAAPSPQRSRDPSRAAARLLLAEQTLLDCVLEPAESDRLVMASTAMNHLRQYVAARAGAGSWWDIDLAAGVSVDDLRVDSEIITAARLRIDIALAGMTRAEAAGQTLPVEYLVRVAHDVGALPPGMDIGRRHALANRFATLAGGVIRLPDGRPSTSRPARFLTTLAIHRTLAAAVRNWRDISAALVRLLHGLAREPALRSQGPDSRLFRVLGSQPDGQVRVAVYADLLQLLPQDYRCRSRSALLPGAVVEAVAEDRAWLHLRECALALERDFACSPFHSERALIGQAAYVMEDLAIRHAGLDRTVVRRSDRARRELLSLAQVLV